MTSKKEWQRARSSEQIELRVAAILDAAGAVFKKESYENVTMLMIAKEAGFTRSNLYRYFKTREEIFIALFMADVDTWVKQVVSVFTKEETIELFAQKWSVVLCQQTRLLELSPLLAPSLEKNTSADMYRKIKVLLYERIGELIPVLQKVLPFMSVDAFFEFFLFHQAFLAGAWPMANYSAMQRSVLDELALPKLVIDFAAFYQKSIYMYLSGVVVDRSKDNHIP